MALSPLPSSEPWAASRSRTGKLRAPTARPSAQAGQEVPHTCRGADSRLSPPGAPAGSPGDDGQVSGVLKKNKTKNKNTFHSHSPGLASAPVHSGCARDGRLEKPKLQSRRALVTWGRQLKWGLPTPTTLTGGPGAGQPGGSRAA